jgi:hypothetical protein
MHLSFYVFASGGTIGDIWDQVGFIRVWGEGGMEMERENSKRAGNIREHGSFTRKPLETGLYCFGLHCEIELSSCFLLWADVWASRHGGVEKLIFTNDFTRENEQKEEKAEDDSPSDFFLSPVILGYGIGI